MENKGRRRTEPRFLRVRPLVAALVAAGTIVPTGVAAKTITVTTSGDAGNGSTCTLRQAVDSINVQALQGACTGSADPFGSAGTDYVDLSALPGTITLAGTEIVVHRPTLFRGSNVDPTAVHISGGGQSRVFRADASVVPVPLVRLAFQHLTVENGAASGSGGCIQADWVTLIESVVTGCTATRGTSGDKYEDIAFGGGVAAEYFFAAASSVVGNSAADGGGGAFASRYTALDHALVANNTVTGGTCQFADSGEAKYACGVVSLGGGGLLTGAAELHRSTVSGNTVNATFLDYTGTGTSGSDGFLGMGGGITSLGGKYEPENQSAASKATRKPALLVRSALMATERGRQAVAAFEAKARARTGVREAWNALKASSAAVTGASKRSRSKADGIQLDGLGLFSSTVSGNRVLAPGNPAVNGKYLGGGIAGLSFFAYYRSSQKYIAYNDEIANSTISGNSLPAVPATPAEPPPEGTPQKGAVGAAWFGSPVDIWNSTVTNNTGRQAAVGVVSGITDTSIAAATKASGRGPFERMRDFSAWARSKGSATAKAARNKDFDQLEWVSTIVADNASDFDVACVGPVLACEIDGSNNLIRIPGVTVPPDTIVGLSAQLAPLANWGGAVNGAPGHASTGPIKTHILYAGSPAIDTGANPGDPNPFEYDERGFGFPRVVGPAADIGAVEGSIPKPVNQPIPAVGPWALGLLSALLGALGLARRRRPTG